MATGAEGRRATTTACASSTRRTWPATRSSARPSPPGRRRRCGSAPASPTPAPGIRWPPPAGIASVQAASREPGPPSASAGATRPSPTSGLALPGAGRRALERYVTIVRTYLRGEPVAFDALAPWHPRTAPAPVAALGLAGTRWTTAGCTGSTPPCRRCRWRSSPPGPRMLAMAARCADRVLLAVGADPERVGMGRRAGPVGERRRADRRLRQRDHPRRPRRPRPAGSAPGASPPSPGSR